MRIRPAPLHSGRPALATATSSDDHRLVDGDKEKQFAHILDVLHAATGIDFSLYREKMIKRRILRRLALRNIHSLAEYGDKLANDSDEIKALQRDLLISVTSFFRDPETFERLKKVVFPENSPRKAAKRDDSSLGSGLRNRRRGLLHCHIVAGISERNWR